MPPKVKYQHNVADMNFNRDEVFKYMKIVSGSRAIIAESRANGTVSCDFCGK